MIHCVHDHRRDRGSLSTDMFWFNGLSLVTAVPSNLNAMRRWFLEGL
jgi:hypothetical protein